MNRLLVSIEVNGKQQTVGTISGNTHRDAVFSYDASWLVRPEAKPLSLSLPLQENPFSPERTRCFFEGLLPEGFTRRSVAQRLRADEQDYTAILAGLGGECLGAIQILEEGASPAEPGYKRLTLRGVRALAEEGSTKAAEILSKTHLSLAGASGKVGLYLETEKNAWFLPSGTAPSTHIVKQSHVRLSDMVVNEQICLMTAAALGIDVPESFIINTGSGKEQEILFATKRYDRVFPESPVLLNGHAVPHRLHQEDFAQALGVSSAEKYEKEDAHYLARMFELLRQYSTDPIADSDRLWERILFHYLIGNTDAHLKNHALLYDPTLCGIRLAPAYDMVCTTVYGEQFGDMSFMIGGEIRLDHITEEYLHRAAAQAGLGVKLAMARFEKMKDNFECALRDSGRSLKEQGFHRATKIRERILRDAGKRV